MRITVGLCRDATRVPLPAVPSEGFLPETCAVTRGPKRSADQNPCEEGPIIPWAERRAI